MANYTIGEVRENEWLEVANMAAHAIPNALISKLGNRFGARFYSKVVQQEYSCGYVAKNSSSNVVGAIIGTTNYPRAHSIAFKGQLLKLVIAANLRLLGWSVITWVIKGILAKVKGVKQDYTDRPHAELVVITVCPEARGTGLAQRLVEQMEKFMVLKELAGPYVILTEKANARANQFYKNIGAKLIRTNMHHGKAINEWHKDLNDRKTFKTISK